MKQFLYHPNGQAGYTGSEPRRDASSRAPLGTINVIFATPARIGSHPSRVMSITWLHAENSNFEPKRARVEIRPALSFSDEDKVGTI